MKKWITYYLVLAVIVAAMPFVAKSTVASDSELTVTVCFSGGNIESVPIEEYVLRALAAREDEVCSLEAKKAFAVAVRSIGMYFFTFGCKHVGFDCCDDGECCVALAPKENAGEKTKNAVRETVGQYLELENAPAMALFTLCASSGTRQCGEFDYLVPVSSGERCLVHKTERDLTAKEVFAIFPEAARELKFYAVYGEDSKLSFAILGNKQIDGEVLAAAFKLKSVEIEITSQEDGIKAVSYGVGQGYGLDLCNAEKMAKGGAYYQKILEFYFPKLKLKRQ